MPTTINVTVFGQFKLEYNGHIISYDLNRSYKTWNLLAFIIMNSKKLSITREDFISSLWSVENYDPGNTLKTQIFRAKEMLKLLDLADTECILSKRGAYNWNPDIIINLDADIFEALITEADSDSLSSKDKISKYIAAVSIYNGTFLPKLSGEAWTASISAYYHGRFIYAVKSVCELLENEKNYQKIIETVSKALSIDELNEALYRIIIKAFVELEKYDEALNYYNTATSLLYKALGVSPSAELRTLYDLIMDKGNTPETELSIIQDELMKNSIADGAFVCEYGYFCQTYQLTKRRSERLSLSSYICLMTLQGDKADLSDSEKSDHYMTKLLEILKLSLRTGDVISRYSSSQYLIMLTCLSFENADMVMRRVAVNFKKRFRSDKISIMYKFTEI